MIRYAITDRRQCPALDTARKAIEAGVDFLQIREKDLSARELLDLARQAVALARGSRTRVLVNTRADIALAAGAHGVHLPSQSISPRRLRAILPPEAVVTVACHSLEEVLRAQDEGAGLALFSPIYQVEGKGPAQGLDVLRQVCRAARLPVIALGGIARANLAECLAAGAAGVAGIRLFSGR